eukprot:13012208-Alexandrium_andersonii.AAC.1
MIVRVSSAGVRRGRKCANAVYIAAGCHRSAGSRWVAGNVQQQERTEQTRALLNRRSGPGVVR